MTTISACEIIHLAEVYQHSVAHCVAKTKPIAVAQSGKAADTRILRLSPRASNQTKTLNTSTPDGSQIDHWGNVTEPSSVGCKPQSLKVF